MPPCHTDKKLAAIRKAKIALQGSLKNCNICPRKCAVNREEGDKGFCRAPLLPVVYSHAPHFGEEPPISATAGSGTIFFSYCNLRCVYCQNYRFSQLAAGEEVSIARLADMMLDLKRRGCHNINLVSPSHYVPQIVDALEIALENGLDIPIVYNTSGYDLPETIKALDGVVDIYLADMRYSDDKMARTYSAAADYVKNDRASVKEMYRQVGDLKVSKDGVGIKGLIIRLLVLPCNISGTINSLSFIRSEISKNAALSIMCQYYPTYRAMEFEELSKGITQEEYMNVVDEARNLGLNEGWTQEYSIKLEDRFLGTNIKPEKEIR